MPTSKVPCSTPTIVTYLENKINKMSIGIVGLCLYSQNELHIKDKQTIVGHNRLKYK